MLNLSNITKPIDIKIYPDIAAGCITLQCRESLYESVKEELLNIQKVYGIPVVLISESVAQITGKTRDQLSCPCQFQIVAWQANIEPAVLAKELENYYNEQKLVVVNLF